MKRERPARFMLLRSCRWLGLLLLLAPGVAPAAAPVTVPIGAAKVDVTPRFPIRLSGYQGRPAEARCVELPLQARALAWGGGEQAAVLITVELIGISEAISTAVARAIEQSHRVPRERVALCVTHTHNGPAVAGVLPFMYSSDLPADQTARIEQFTRDLQSQLIAVARAALDARQPGTLAWGEGRAGFAVQRRRIVDGKWVGFGVDAGGQVDHALPVLCAKDADGTVRAVLASYACHCTTLQTGDNFLHGDWAGEAAARIEAAHPGAIGMIAIGCGADANPATRTIAAVAQHGVRIATEVGRVLQGGLRPVGPVTTAAFRRFDLALDHVVTAEELRARVAADPRPAVAYSAGRHLAALDRGEALPRAVPYAVQTWTLGNELALVFLGGEVVSEYSLRLRRELDGARLWVNAYANTVPCYVPSRRMYSEGGYEVDGSMDFYGWPARLAVGTEDRIVAVVKELLPPTFHRQDRRAP